MRDLTIRTRYATHPGSNVGDILATGGGRSHRRRIDQSTHLEDNYRAAAVTLAGRMGYPESAVPVESTRAGNGARLFTLTGTPTPAPEPGDLAAEPWPADTARYHAATARQCLNDHGHGWHFRDSDERTMTRENCGACVLAGYGVKPAEEGPNYAGWARIYVEARRPVPADWRGAFRRELASDNRAYAGALARSIATFGVTFTDGGAL